MASFAFMSTPSTDHPSTPRLASGTASVECRRLIADALQRANSVLLSSHRQVDADGCGSALALAHGLRRLGKKVAVVFASPVPPNLAFLPGVDGCIVAEKDSEVPDDLRNPDVFLSLDNGALNRLGPWVPVAQGAELFLNVDHHVSNEGFGDLRWVDAGYSATGVMAYELLCELGVELDREMLLCAYTALVVDTGNFSFSNSDPRSHRMAATCLERGVHAEEVTAALKRTRSLGSWKLEAEAVDRLRTADDGAIAWTTITNEMLKRHDVKREELPDMVTVPVSLNETLLAFTLTEATDGKIRASLRSRCPVGVHKVAGNLGGGGHPRAAGMTLGDDLEAAEGKVLAAMRSAIEEWRRKNGTDALPPQDA
ncbi:MAG: DHH family phosphoesterase [Planctomycetota bacterium]|jgi:phosphoesterase RecJ-like protein